MNNGISAQELLGKTSYSGSDISVYGMLSGRVTGTGVSELRDIQTISVSSFREKIPVNGLGSANALSFTHGPRTYAGSIITTVVKDHPFSELIDAGIELPEYFDSPFSYDDRLRRANKDRRYNMDAMPPITLVIVFFNEMGNFIANVIYDITFTQAVGLTMSVDDAYTENTHQYRARDAVILSNMGTQQGAYLKGYNWMRVIDDPEFDPTMLTRQQIIEHIRSDIRASESRALKVQSSKVGPAV